nr:flavodoxin family protein [Pseudonocardia acidicola]
MCASPRTDGNSRLMAESLRQGAVGSGHDVGLVELHAVMNGLLRDCRTCRRPDGRCSIEDGFADLVHDHVVPADAVVYATPLYWYGMAASLKNFFDRLVCYVSASYPRRGEVAKGLVGQRTGLLLASEESYLTAGLGVIFQLQEITRYMHQEFVGAVAGVGNQRGEVAFDPADPLAAAERLGAEMFTRHYSDYWLDSERPNTVWAAPHGCRREMGPYGDV